MWSFGPDTGLALILAFVIFLVLSTGIVLVLWIALPFSVFGLKGLLRKAVDEQEKTNMLLKTLIETLKYSEGRAADAGKDEKHDRPT